MAKLSKIQISILKSTLKLMKNHSAFSFSEGVFFIDNNRLYFQSPYYTIILKIPLLSTEIKPGMVLSGDTNSLYDFVNTIKSDSYIVYLELSNELALTNGDYQIGCRCLSYNLLYESIHKRDHGKRFFKFKSDDIHYLRTAIDFATKFNEYDGTYAHTIMRNIRIGQRVYATDGVFGYMSNVLKSEISSFQYAHIPKAIANIIKYSDKDIVVRLGYGSGLSELENEYFNIFYIPPSARDFQVSKFHESATDQVIVSRKDLIESLRHIKKSFKNITSKRPHIDADLKVYVNGLFRMEPRNVSDNSSGVLVHDFEKSFTEDVSFDTYGNRFLKILSTIKDDKITIKIPRGDIDHVVINDTYILTSIMDWI